MTAKKTSTTAKAELPADVEALSPEPDLVTLASGFVVRVEPLKFRGMLKLLKIVTRGAGPILMQMPLDFDDPEAFVQQLLAVIVMAVPEAEDEAVSFIQSMATPAELIADAQTKDQQHKNKELIEKLVDELDDPEIEDAIGIIEAIVRNEARDIQALGKRLGSILRTQMPTLSN